MGRPGVGGGSSGGGHSGGSFNRGGLSGGSLRGGSSRPSGGSRPMSRPTRGFGGGSSGGHSAPPPPPRHHSAPPPPPRHYGAPPPPPRHYGAPPPPPRGGYYGGAPRRRGGCVSEILSWFIAFLIIIIALGFYMIPRGGGSSGSIPSSSYNREKLESGNAYINDCVDDRVGWFENIERTESKLRNFYDETGVQPYIVLMPYDSDYATDDARYKWAEDYYTDNIQKEYNNNSTFLYVYFENEDSNELGYDCYVNGLHTGSVMDAEAVNIFKAYLDEYWYDENLTMDDVFVKTFDSTANRIMTKTTTSNDVKKYVLIAVAAGVVIFGVVKVVKLKHKRAKEEAEETERILNTPMENLVDEELKKTAAKYDEQK